jgi:hypothetical protein
MNRMRNDGDCDYVLNKQPQRSESETHVILKIREDYWDCEKIKSETDGE